LYTPPKMGNDFKTTVTGENSKVRGGSLLEHMWSVIIIIFSKVFHSSISLFFWSGWFIARFKNYKNLRCLLPAKYIFFPFRCIWLSVCNNVLNVSLLKTIKFVLRKSINFIHWALRRFLKKTLNLKQRLSVKGHSPSWRLLIYSYRKYANFSLHFLRYCWKICVLSAK